MIHKPGSGLGFETPQIIFSRVSDLDPHGPAFILNADPDPGVKIALKF